MNVVWCIIIIASKNNHIVPYRYRTVPHHIIGLDLKRQNRLKVGTYKRQLKVKMQSVSDNDVRKRLLKKLSL